MATKPKPKAQPAGPGTVNESMPAAPVAGETTKVIVEGEPVNKDPLHVPTRQRPVGRPHTELTGRIDMPPVSEAQLAAGPPRPEPARQVRATEPGYVPDEAAEEFMRKPIKWVKVRATRTLFTGVGAAGVRRRAGDVFMVDDRLFQRSSMELVPTSTPEGRKTAQDVIDEEHDARLGGRVTRPTGSGPAIADANDGGGQ